jgi:predicted unusual protein kinase regulating ubiquinone biosynthesis (AarF/ABC1/UbiB family)
MKKVKKIKNSFISRNLSIAKIFIKTGRGLLSSNSGDLKELLRDGLEGQLEMIVHELGLMKGSLMKAGQMISLHSGDFLPPEGRKVLSLLENQSYFLAWETIEEEIPNSWLKELEIDPIPLAAASIGQVHLAREKSTQKKLALKIQYSGVKKAIDHDVRALKFLLKMLNLLPKKLDSKFLFEEIKKMLKQETNYEKELQHTLEFAHLCKDTPYVKVITPVERYCTKKILTTEYIEGFSLRSEEVKNLTQKIKNRLGEQFLELYFMEVFKWGKMQTDGHFGNFLIEKVGEDYRWVLLDFGATKDISKRLQKNYQNLILACALKDEKKLFESVKKVLKLEDLNYGERELLVEYAKILGVPFTGGIYDWGASSISQNIMNLFPKVYRSFGRGKHGDTLFLDRKLGGVYRILQQLGAKFDPKKVLDKFV